MVSKINESETERSVSFAHGLRVFVMCFGHILCSLLITFINKLVMNHANFPYPMFLTLIHATVVPVILLVPVPFCPHLYPSLTDPEKRKAIDVELLVKGLFPMAGIFASISVFNNAALMWGSVVFLQLVKQSGIVFIYLGALVCSLTKFEWVRFQLLFLVFVGSIMTMAGNLDFMMLPFAVQLVGVVLDAALVTLQAVILTDKSKAIDPMTFTLLVMPICFVMTSLTMLLAKIFVPHPSFQIPEARQLIDNLPLILASAVTAAMLNVFRAGLLQVASSVGYILTCRLKDIAIVIVGVLTFDDTLGRQQIAGFSLQTVSITAYSLISVYPTAFDGGVIAAVKRWHQHNWGSSILGASRGYGGTDEVKDQKDQKV